VEDVSVEECKQAFLLVCFFKKAFKGDEVCVEGAGKPENSGVDMTPDGRRFFWAIDVDCRSISIIFAVKNEKVPVNEKLQLALNKYYSYSLELVCCLRFDAGEKDFAVVVHPDNLTGTGSSLP
jgi:hypothetical protein